MKKKKILGPLADKWTTHKGEIPLVSPANKRLLDIIVVGTGLNDNFPSQFTGNVFTRL